MKGKRLVLGLAVLLLLMAMAAVAGGAAAKTKIVHYMAGHGDTYFAFLEER
ncbi:MAG TPA: hypothetical protein GXX29_07145 [Firmicutes bacterium]|nr:hypothetical protein [Bacillota bacterium]